MNPSLYIVATPIGNLKDITLRAIEVLSSVDAIYCEDTRTSKKLMNAHKISTPLYSYHTHSSSRIAEHIMHEIQSGKSIAYISDAGTPGISDPAHVLKQYAYTQNIPCIPIPGVSAVITALQASNAHTHSFTYLGFLPIKKGRKTLFESLQHREHTIVFYESPHRLQKTLQDIMRFLGENTTLSLGREMTKIFEEYLTDTVENILKKHTTIKGEYTIIIHK